MEEIYLGRPVISIVIPTFNCALELKQTLESLNKQEFNDFECLVVDGNSTDSTVTIAEEYKGKVRFPITISIGKDNGIYDAMNKGVQLARGQYIQFMGAGDTLVDSTTLDSVVRFCSKGRYDVIYGYVNIDGHVGKTIKNRINFFTTFRYRPICHQAIFAKREWLKRFPFELDYKYVADQAWIMKTYANHAKYKYIKIPIANYNLNGFSSTEQGKREGRKEIMEAKKNAFPLQYTMIRLLKKRMGE